MVHTLSIFAALLPAVLAVPSVKVIPLNPSSCIGFPGFLQTPPGFTGALQFEIASADDPAVNGLLGTVNSATSNLVLDLRASRRFAKEQYRCWNGDVLPIYGADAKIFSISKDHRNAHIQLKEKAQAGYPLEPYALEVDGKRLDGVYLGTQNRTTWGFNYEQGACGSSPIDWYSARLQGLPVDPNAGASPDPEFEGFLKVVIW